MGISEIQNMLGMPGGNPFDQSLNTTDSPSFVDGDFSGILAVDDKLQFGATDTNTFIKHISDDWVYWAVGGLTMFSMSGGGANKAITFNGNENQDINFQVGYNGGRAIDMDGANGNVLFGADASVASGGSFKVFNLGDSHTNTANTEYLKIFAQTNSFKIKPEISGTGTRRDLILQTSYGDSHSNIRLDQYGLLRLRYYNNDHIMIGSGYTQVGVNLYPTNDNTIQCGVQTKRWSTVNSVDGDFSGEVTTNTLTGDGTGSVFLKQPSTGSPIWVFHGGAVSYGFYNTTLRPAGSGTIELGAAANRWEKVWSVNGSFSGNLNFETGGSFKLFNLGDSHTNTTNTEYLEFEATGTDYFISAKQTGTGAQRTFVLEGASDDFISFYKTGGITLGRSGTNIANFKTSEVWFNTVVVPAATGSHALGTTAKRWGNVVSVAGDFSETVKVGDGSLTAPSYSFNSQSTMGIYRAATNQINMIAAANGFGFNLQPSSLSISSGMHFGWRSTSNVSQGHSFDTLLARDATGIIAQRNFFSDAPQAFRIYGTWTDSSNGEWLQMDHGVTHANIATISNKDNGTGTGRHLYIKGADQLRLYSGGNLLHWAHTGTQAIYYKDAIRPHGTSDFGTTVNRWANGYFVNGDFSGTLTTDLIQGGQSQLKLNEAATQLLNIHNAAATTQYFSFRTNAFLPKISNIKLGLPVSTARWLEVHAVGGSYQNLNVETGGSFKVFNLGDSHTNTTNTELVSLYSSGNVNYLYSSATGSGTVRDLKLGTASNNIWFRSAFGIVAFTAGGSPRLECTAQGVLIVNSNDLFPWVDNASLCGKTDKRWSTVNSVDGDFSGNISTSSITSDGTNPLTIDGGSTTSSVRILLNSNNRYLFENTQFRPNADNFASLGSPTRKWTNVYSYNGSFSGNLNVETGGSFKLFNLGDSHTNTTNTEFISMGWATNDFEIIADATGTGTVQDIDIAGNQVALKHNNGSSISTRLSVDSSSVKVWRNFYGGTDGLYACGLATNRWSIVNSVDADLSGTLTVDAITPTTDLTIGDNLKNTHLKGAYVRLYDGNDLQLNIDSSYCTVYGLGIRGSHDNTRPMGYESRIWSEVWQGKSNVRGSFVDASNYGHLSIEPDGDNYLIKANSLGTTADASITIQTSQTSAGGTETIVFDTDYNGRVNFTFGGNLRGYWGKSILQANVQVATNTNFVINRTWNNAATVFQGYDANITDTASDANSNLLNLKVDGVQKFRVKKDGACTAASFITAGNVDFTGLPTSDPNIDGRLYNDSGTLKISSGGSPPP